METEPLGAKKFPKMNTANQPFLIYFNFQFFCDTITLFVIIDLWNAGCLPHKIPPFEVVSRISIPSSFPLFRWHFLHQITIQCIVPSFLLLNDKFLELFSGSDFGKPEETLNFVGLETPFVLLSEKTNKINSKILNLFQSSSLILCIVSLVSKYWYISLKTEILSSRKTKTKTMSKTLN